MLLSLFIFYLLKFLFLFLIILSPPSFPLPSAAGSFESAMDIMNKTTGIVNFAPLKGHFMNAYCASRAPLSGFANGTPLTVFMQDVSDLCNSFIYYLNTDSFLPFSFFSFFFF